MKFDQMERVGGVCSEPLQLFALAPRSGERVRVRGPRFYRSAVPLTRRPSAADLSPLSRGEVQTSLDDPCTHSWGSLRGQGEGKPLSAVLA